MKKLAATLAALLVLSCGTTFLAAPSPEAGAQSPEAGGETTEVEITDATAVDSTGKTVEVTINSTVEAETIAAAEAEAEKRSEGSQVLAIVKVEVPEGTGKVTITFDVDGVKATDKGTLYILHEEKPGDWEVIWPDDVKDGKITATFNSLSPVAICKIADTATTLPKTGAPVVLPVVALICAAGAVGCAKKVKFN